MTLPSEVWKKDFIHWSWKSAYPLTINLLMDLPIILDCWYPNILVTWELAWITIPMLWALPLAIIIQGLSVFLFLVNVPRFFSFNLCWSERYFYLVNSYSDSISSLTIFPKNCPWIFNNWTWFGLTFYNSWNYALQWTISRVSWFPKLCNFWILGFFSLSSVQNWAWVWTTLETRSWYKTYIFWNFTIPVMLKEEFSVYSLSSFSIYSSMIALYLYIENSS